MSTDDTGPTGEAGGRATLGRIAIGVVLVVVLVAAAFARQGLWHPTDDPPVVPSGDGGTAVAPRTGTRDAAGPRVAGRPAPPISPPVVTVPRAEVPDAATLFGTRIVAVSYRAPATVVTRDGTRFRAGDALPSGATLGRIRRGGLTVTVDGVEMVLDPTRGAAPPDREAAGSPR